MNWLSRIKLTWEVYLRTVLPVYAWLLIYILSLSVMFIIVIITAVVALLGARPELADTLSNLDPSVGPDPSLMGNFTDPLAIVDYVTSIIPPGFILGTILLAVAVAIISDSAFTAGIFNITAKAKDQKIKFTDFHFSGFKRILAWESLLALVALAVIGIALAAFINFYDMTESIWTLVFWIAFILIVVGSFLLALPWLAIGGYYLLAHREQNFWIALRGSWKFYLSNLGTLWILAVMLISYRLLLFGMSSWSPDLANLFSMLSTPFIVILPIVWVLTTINKAVPSVTAEPPQEIPAPAYYQRISPSAIPTAEACPAPTHSEKTLGEDTQSPAFIPVKHPVDSCTTMNQPVPKPLPQPFVDTKDDVTLTKPAIPNYRFSLPDDMPSVPEDCCPTCGRQITNPNAAYCSQCGTKL